MEINKIANEIAKLSSIELDELSTALLENNISATLYRFSGIPSENKTTATVVLRNTGIRKLMLVKTLKEYMGIGLKEAKDIVDSVPCVIIEDISIEAAEMFKEALDECGATVEIH